MYFFFFLIGITWESLLKFLFIGHKPVAMLLIMSAFLCEAIYFIQPQNIDIAKGNIKMLMCHYN